MKVTRLIPLACLGLLLGAAPAVLEAQRPGAILRRVPRKKGPRNPAQVKKQINRLNEMDRDDRKKALEKLPPERRHEAERRLDKFRQLTPEEQDRRMDELRRFDELPPQRKRALRQAYADFSKQPEGRRDALRQEFTSLSKLSSEERRTRLDSPEFREQFDEDERQLLGRVSDLLAPETVTPSNREQ